jgi:hypothetical protein
MTGKLSVQLAKVRGASLITIESTYTSCLLSNDIIVTLFLLFLLIEIRLGVS